MKRAVTCVKYGSGHFEHQLEINYLWFSLQILGRIIDLKAIRDEFT